MVSALLNGRGGDGTPLQYSRLENPMDGGAWWAAVHGVAKSQTGLSFSRFTFMHWRRKWQATPVFLPGESQGLGSLVVCRLWGCTESDTTEATQQQQPPPKWAFPVAQTVKNLPASSEDPGLIPGQRAGSHMLQLNIQYPECHS